MAKQKTELNFLDKHSEIWTGIAAFGAVVLLMGFAYVLLFTPFPVYVGCLLCAILMPWGFIVIAAVAILFYLFVWISVFRDERKSGKEKIEVSE